MPQNGIVVNITELCTLIYMYMKQIKSLHKFAEFESSIEKLFCTQLNKVENTANVGVKVCVLV